MLRVGLLGCGRHGERYLRHLRDDVRGAVGRLIYRRDRHAGQELARRYGVELASSREELLAHPEVDAILIATPPGGHLEEIRLAVDAGKPVLVEKPVVIDAEQAVALRELLRERPAARVMVAQTLRYSPVLQRARRRREEVGRLHRVRVAQRLEPSGIEWQRDPGSAGGGSVLLTGVHLFDLLRWFLGRTPDSVGCRHRSLLGHPLENAFDACFEYESEGILASTEVSKFSQSRSACLELVGSDGQLEIDYLHGLVWRIRGRNRELVEETTDIPSLPGTLRDFVRMAEGRIDPPITVEDGCEAVRMAMACYRAHSENRRVSV